MAQTVVLNFHETLLRRSDVRLLEGPHWLNDNVISFYFEYLEKVVFHGSKDLLFVTPEVTQCIKMVGSSEIKTFLGPLGVESKKFVFFALNDNDSPDTAGGTHWTLLVYSKPEGCFYHVDSSSGSSHDVAWNFASHLMTFFSRHGSVNFVNKECYQQGNGYDCGIHVIHNTQVLANHCNQTKEINNCDLHVKFNAIQKRKEILSIINLLIHS